MRKIKRIVFGVIGFSPFWWMTFVLVVVLGACSPVKRLGENQQLYTGATVLIVKEDASSAEKKELKTFAQQIIRPRPNSLFLGKPIKMLVYQWMGGQENTSKWKGWVQRKMGEMPVLYERVDPAFTSRLIENELDNIGYFRVEVSHDTIQRHKKVHVNYILHPGVRYKIAKLSFPQPDNSLSEAISALQPGSLLQEGLPYSLDLVKAERLRIDELLKEQGFYYFSPDYLLVQADSAVGGHRVNLQLIIKPETPALAYEQFRVRNIRIEPEQDFRRGILEDMLAFQRDSFYNRTNHNLALHRLVSMGTFQFVRNRFVVADTTGNYLDAIYSLTPFASMSLRAELSARTNSANYSGTALTVNWNHRNAFKGAELLSVSAHGAMDFQVGQGTSYNLYRTGMETSIVWPRLVAPLKVIPQGRFIPKTRASLGYELQHRAQLYTKHQFNTSFGYQWRSNIRSEHRFMLADISYVNPAFVSAAYQRLIVSDPGLKKIVERELIIGPSYSYEYTNTMDRERVHRLYSKSTVQTSAMLLGLVKGNWGQPMAADVTAVADPLHQPSSATLLGVPFSQFVRMEQEYRHYIRLSPAFELAGRAVAGAGMPFGNSVSMPFARQFFTGGANSLRAFPARSVGPGVFRSPAAGADFLPDASGDIKLEMNAELRAQLIGVLHGALFVDAGNVWLMKESVFHPGGAFAKGFLKELAVGTGAGLRFDFSMIVLRIDLAIPLRKPWLPDGNRWVGAEADFGTFTWWKANRMWNIAIGYPF
jgi:outer membrane protein insertion porin family